MLVIYCTFARNRWGINVGPVFCPCCKASLPSIRPPQNLRQTLWGGGTCTKCGTEVDKWGREAPSQRRPDSTKSLQPQDETRYAFKRRLAISMAVGCFFLTLLFDW